MDGLVGQDLAGGGFGNAEINHLGHRHAVVERDQDVGGLDVPMDDALLVRVLDGVANLHEQLEPLLGGQVVLVAVVGDLDPAHQFHHKEGPARVRRAGVEHLGDIGMVHERQRLALGLEPGDDLLGVHAQLDDLEGDPAADGLLLLGQIDHPAAALADLLEQLVAANLVAGFLGDQMRIVAPSLGCSGRKPSGASWACSRAWTLASSAASSPQAPLR